MKTITIRLPDVEAAMLIEVQKVNKAYRDIQGLLVSQIQEEYAKTPNPQGQGIKVIYMAQPNRRRIVLDCCAA